MNDRTKFISRTSENCFKQLCVDSGLTPTEPRYDENGWDCFVELPKNALVKVPRDSQPQPIKCLVQVKSTDALGNGVEMTISNWENLANNSMPTFVVIFDFNNKNRPEKVYFCHIGEDRISKALKRIREIESEGELERFHKRKMLFVPELSELLNSVEDKILIKAIKKATGNSMSEYVALKASILKTVGFEERPIILTFKAKDNLENYVNAFLGLRDIEVSNIASSTLRFGIELPQDEFASGTLSITPTSAGVCTLEAFSKSLRRTIALSGDVFVPSIPNLPEALFKVLVKAGSMRLVISRNTGSFSLDFQDETIRELEKLTSEAIFLDIMQKPDIKLVLKTASAATKFSFDKPLSKNPYFQELRTRLNILNKVVKKSRCNNDMMLCARDLFNQNKAISWLQMINLPSKIEISFIEIEGLPNINGRAGFFAGHVTFKAGQNYSIIFCIWSAIFASIDDGLKIETISCTVFRKIDNSAEPQVTIDNEWAVFTTYCNARAKKSPLFIYKAPFDMGEHNTATLAVGDKNL